MMVFLSASESIWNFAPVVCAIDQANDCASTLTAIKSPPACLILS